MLKEIQVLAPALSTSTVGPQPGRPGEVLTQETQALAPSFGGQRSSAGVCLARTMWRRGSNFTARRKVVHDSGPQFPAIPIASRRRDLAGPTSAGQKWDLKLVNGQTRTTDTGSLSPSTASRGICPQDTTPIRGPMAAAGSRLALSGTAPSIGLAVPVCVNENSAGAESVKKFGSNIRTIKGRLEPRSGCLPTCEKGGLTGDWATRAGGYLARCV